MGKNFFRLIPKVDDILEEDLIIKLGQDIPRKVLIDSIREELDILREKLKKQELKEEEVGWEISKLGEKIDKRARDKSAYKLRRVVNGTGVVIHTNIGRSPINDQIMDNIREIAVNYSNLELDLATGKRGLRYDHLEEIIKEITGAEAALVVNNNAAAVLLALSSLAKGKEAIVSRGELIEIGGAFRIPDVMEESGARLVAVGTTNKTHLWDYEKAITEETGLLLKVHTSNYRILGFTSTVDSEELASLKERYGLPLIEDLGSGTLVDLGKLGLDHEPTVQESLDKGVDIVTFSGDKLLGGPQAGIIVGKKEYIEIMKKNPLTRAFRVDKFTLAALEGVLGYYRDEDKAIREIPTLRMLNKKPDQLEKEARELKGLIQEKLGNERDLQISIEDSYSEVGGGSLPLERLASKTLVLKLDQGSSQALEEALRRQPIPIISRLYRDRIYLDLRTIRKEEYEIVAAAIDEAVKSLKESHI